MLPMDNVRFLLLLFLTESEIRPTDPDYAQGYKVMFSDGFPFLIASQVQFRVQNSLDEGCVCTCC